MNMLESTEHGPRRMTECSPERDPRPRRRPHPLTAAPFATRDRPVPSPHSIASRLGCIVVRRIVDGRGIEWTVRELKVDAPQRTLGGVPEVILIFCSDVPSLRPEAREVDRPLEALGGQDLLLLLERSTRRRQSA